ncbi:hypothetical protein [Arenibacter sp. F20364]|uniref:hypothetical protein n=1 Tax=Arenibacter sp. F20364 TaxID=2926415 RepID=UPI001FF6E1C4|nr:hypothetical protein [Arenibacter sp. F20364]MCK0192646.1 hypothetical protein [Arenibacter sp. F20364]
MEQVRKLDTKEHDSFKSAHMLSEFSQILQNIGTDLENSVSLFDSVGEKNELFKKFEESINSPVESLIDMHKISKDGINNFVFNKFVGIFKGLKDKFNFIHVGNTTSSDIIFFISTKEEEIKNILTKNEYEYATGDLSEFINISFCFVEQDMEKDLFNTQKLNLNNA